MSNNIRNEQNIIRYSRTKGQFQMVLHNVIRRNKNGAEELFEVVMTVIFQIKGRHISTNSESSEIT